ncbi:hypothetical protein [uncultured Parasphingorhabdus sp.]|uniref:hypothetical protein n=1 Tax=uncultured Parasphingorhabdus sp. TaxID=2709694 RepID=UPI0030DD3366
MAKQGEASILHREHQFHPQVRIFMRVFDNFDRIRIINLPNRSDRRREMDRELANMGLLGDPRIDYFAAIRPNDAGPFTSIGARGVYESQKQLLREAAESGQSLLILEDDCDFIPGAEAYQVPEDCGIFYGGHNAAQPNNLQSSDIMGAHMMGFSKDCAKAVSKYLAQLRCEGIHPPIDAAYVWFRRAYPDVVTHFAVPPLAGQRASRSDIATLRWYDRLPVLRTFINLIRSARRK